MQFLTFIVAFIQILVVTSSSFSFERVKFVKESTALRGSQDGPPPDLVIPMGNVSFGGFLVNSIGYTDANCNGII